MYFRILSSWLMCFKHSLSLEACLWATALLTEAQMSSMGYLLHRLTKGVVSYCSTGWFRVVCMMERKNMPNMSEHSSPSLVMETAKQFWERFFLSVSILVRFVSVLNQVSDLQDIRLRNIVGLDYTTHIQVADLLYNVAFDPIAFSWALGVWDVQM